MTPLVRFSRATKGRMPTGSYDAQTSSALLIWPRAYHITPQASRLAHLNSLPPPPLHPLLCPLPPYASARSVDDVGAERRPERVGLRKVDASPFPPQLVMISSSVVRAESVHIAPCLWCQVHKKYVDIVNLVRCGARARSSCSPWGGEGACRWLVVENGTVCSSFRLYELVLLCLTYVQERSLYLVSSCLVNRNQQCNYFSWAGALLSLPAKRPQKREHHVSTQARGILPRAHEKLQFLPLVRGVFFFRPGRNWRQQQQQHRRACDC